MIINALSEAGSSVEMRADRIDGPLLAKVDIPRSENWKLTSLAGARLPAGVHDLFVVLKAKKPVSIDWIRFE